MVLTPGFDFEGQVVAITGAGRGIGREYARLLADAGARVVVNDLGTDVSGEGSDEMVAADVAAELRARGGRAVADDSDVSTPEGGAGIVEAALVAFGRLDALIHNAGTQHVAPYPEMPTDAVQHILGTHLLGAFHVGQPAWRVMAAQGYGRIVLTASVGMLGAPNLSAYAAAKAG